MKLMHLSDLHLGKRVKGFSMIEDQRIILQQIIQIACEEKIDGIMIAGDIYDKTVPPIEAVQLLDQFLSELAAKDLPVFLISGNHDSAGRLDFASSILKENGIYIAGRYDGRLQKFTLQDEFGAVNLYLMPYIRPTMVREATGQEVSGYQQAVEAVLENLPENPMERNILIAHQFVTSGSIQPELSDSETRSLGGTDQIDASVFDGFDYVALGHLHGPQRIGEDTIRYSGSPLKYSFSECRQHKSACIVTLGKKGQVTYQLIPLVPLHDMRKIRGELAQLLSSEIVQAASREDYLHVTLTDEESILDAVGKVRAVYPNLMQLEFDNRRSHAGGDTVTAEGLNILEKSPIELFAEFYCQCNGQPMKEEQEALIRSILEDLRGDVG